MNIENHKAYFAALADGLQEYLPPELPLDGGDLVKEAKRLMGIELQHFRLGQVHSIMPTVIKENEPPRQLPTVLTDKESGIFSTENGSTFGALLNELKPQLAHLRLADNARQSDYTLYHHLYRYAARIGCDPDTPETSLFDQNRLLAATTACLKQLNNQDRKFYLVKGDLSGIQGFIYANFSLEKPGDGRKSSKRLRGRSFLVAMLTNYIAEYVVEKLGLFQANIIFAGGGHFNLLIPGNKGNDLEKIGQDINKMLLDEVGTTTSLVLAKVDIKAKEDDPTPFKDVSKYYAELSTEIERKKRKRNLTGLDIFMSKTTDNEQLKKLNDIGMQLGETIPRADVLAQIELENEDDVQDIKKENGVVFHLKKAKTVFVAFKSNYIEKNPIDKFIKRFSPKIKSVKIIQLNETDLTESMTNIPQTGNIPISYGFTFVGKYAPTFTQAQADDYNTRNKLKKFEDKYKDGDVKPFDELAKMCYNPDDNFDFPQLAIVRLDIDNLGSIFARGLGRPSTFQRLATLSREFNQFFSGYFNVLAKEYEIYITYSGGDDAFVVGSWYNVLHFMVALKEKFDEFVCKNECITFSAGIFMCHPHYPVGRFAKDAAAYEGKAKVYKKDRASTLPNADCEKVKNAVHIFDHTLSWSSFSSKMDFAIKLLGYTNQEGTKDPDKLARSLIHRLLRILRSCLKNDGSVIVDTHKITANVARLHYLFARHKFDEKRIKEATKGIAKEVVELILKDFDNPDIVADYLIPFNYVIMKTRKMN